MTVQLRDIAAASAIDTFQTSGLVTLPRLFAVEESAWLAQEAHSLNARLSGRPKGTSSSGSSDEAPDGTLFDVDVYEEPFRRLVAHPRLLRQVRAVLPEALYVHRTRLIAARRPADTVWRRDFPTWQRLAGLAAPRMVTAAVFLGEPVSGGPGLWVRPLATSSEVTAPQALTLPQGSVALLHGDLAYALDHEQNGAARPIFLITYNAMSNQPEASAWVGVGSFRPRPLEATLTDDCLWPPAYACAG